MTYLVSSGMLTLTQSISQLFQVAACVVLVFFNLLIINYGQFHSYLSVGSSLSTSHVNITTSKIPNASFCNNLQLSNYLKLLGI